MLIFSFNFDMISPKWVIFVFLFFCLLTYNSHLILLLFLEVSFNSFLVWGSCEHLDNLECQLKRVVSNQSESCFFDDFFFSTFTRYCYFALNGIFFYLIEPGNAILVTISRGHLLFSS